MTEARSAGAAVLLLVAGIAILAAASRIVVPLNPVPVTAQTLAVTVIGALYGWRLGAATMVAWLALAAAGAPLLADGAAGIARFAGPTGGYLLAFPFAAALVGALGAMGWSRRFASAFGAMILGNALCLTIGAVWLTASIGIAAAVSKGVLPFLPGALIKSIIGAAIVRVLKRA